MMIMIKAVVTIKKKKLRSLSLSLGSSTAYLSIVCLGNIKDENEGLGTWLNHALPPVQAWRPEFGFLTPMYKTECDSVCLQCSCLGCRIGFLGQLI